MILWSQVTVYAFSIENFRRSEEEVNALLQLAKEKFEVLVVMMRQSALRTWTLCLTYKPMQCRLLSLMTRLPQALVKEADQLAKHGVRVRVLGNTSLLPAVGNSGCDQI